ncbi:hypothetical protein CONCODRAFT_8444 [Conidiobolus coronatus NRRL 28638]|uniref:Uncharacterized protein n=1 Tax=Conidiobolus coronatus (strain ATCC 28846 / CBS 209.66 / NRRL 28638) TaxID=796925 RepID=A0A137P277_CONC2|nr:hypothetical protein CONCODRAFT_8444 [Conidiobolus coronatus NRRL 28638]|eukprot:KXN69156.1 hypothetical protein CONCODRAFT_8444 [Conidiobolus coronatus NRRL 28638]
MYLIAQNYPCLLMISGYPKAIEVIDSKIAVRDSHFSKGSRFTIEKIGKVYYLKYKGNYISYKNKSLIVTDKNYIITELVYLVPYCSSLFSLKYKDDYLDVFMQPQTADYPIIFQWANIYPSLSNYEMQEYYDTYDFLERVQIEYVSIDGLDILNCNFPLYLTCDGNFNKRLEYNEEDYLFEFVDSSIMNGIPLKFCEYQGDICVYSEEFGYLQIGYDQEWEAHQPVFSKDDFEFPIVLEKAELYSTYFLKYDSAYIQVINHDNYTFGIFTEKKEEASVFQITSSF